MPETRTNPANLPQMPGPGDCCARASAAAGIRRLAGLGSADPLPTLEERRRRGLPAGSTEGASPLKQFPRALLEIFLQSGLAGWRRGSIWAEEGPELSACSARLDDQRGAVPFSGPN